MKKAVIRGIVEKIAYENTFGWVVIKIRQNGELVKALGQIGKITVGETWQVDGQWQYVPEHGRQFKIFSGFPIMPEKSDELIALLSGKQFPGIGISTASNLVKAYGEKLWEVLEKEPQRLESDGIITPRKAQLILTALNGLRARWDLLRFLVKHSLPVRLLQPLGTLYLDEAVESIKDNPYRLLTFLDWSLTDSTALSLGIEQKDKRRCKAAVIEILQRYLKRGHTAVFRKVLVKEASELIAVHFNDIEGVLHEPLISFANKDLVQLTGIASQERTVANAIAKLTYEPQPLVDKKWVENWLEQYESSNSIKLDFHQKLAVHEAVYHRILVLTGGPGTGKTSVINAIQAIFTELGENIMLSAPTGRAAQRIQESTGKIAKTLHRTFGYSQRAFDFKQQDNELPTLIVDESSMVDLRMWNTIVSGINERTRLIIVGDPGQLPSVGPGQVLNDLILSNVPVVELKKIHRQASDNPIPYVSAAIRQGEKSKLSNWKGEKKGVYLIPHFSEKIGTEITVKLVTENLLNQGFSVEEIQVLSPLKRGFCGTNNINKLIREKLGRRDLDDKIPFALDDRVIQTVNNYDLGTNGLMNGTTGMVFGHLKDGVIVSFDKEQIEVTGNALADMDYAYSISVHKSQGSQYPVVVIPLYPSAGPLLNRQLIYTAITRATELAIIVGTEEALHQAVDSHSLTLRNTAFSIHLEEALIVASKKPLKPVSMQTRMSI